MTPDADALASRVDQAAQRALFSYLTAEAAEDYIAILTLFTDTLLADLSAADVAARLAETALGIDAELVEARCQQLVVWGNLVTSVRDARVPSIAGYHRARSRFQVSKLGGRLHREALAILRAADGAREVARELLARIAETLAGILAAVSDPHAERDPEQIAAAVTGTFNDHRMFAESVSDFYAYVAGLLSRYDLAGEEYGKFKGLLLDYVDLISADVSRNSPLILERLQSLLPLIDRVLDVLPNAALLAASPTAVERLPGRTRAEWEELSIWYGAGTGRSGPDQLRGAANQALAQLITNAKRMLAAHGTGISRRSDLLKLATWFHDAGTDSDTAHRIFDAAFGLYPARHLLLGPDEADPRLGPTHSWWASDPIQVPVSLRERGDRNQRGRTARVPDPGADRERLLARAEKQLAARRAAAAELAAAGTLDGASVSPAARDLVLDKFTELLGDGLFTAGLVVERTDTDLGITLRAEPDAGASTVVTSPDGVLTMHGVRLTARSVAAAPAIDEPGVRTA